MDAEGIDATGMVGAAIESMGEVIQLIFETAEGKEFVVRLPAEALRVALPEILSVPGRASEEADPIGTPAMPVGSHARSAAVLLAAAVVRASVDDGSVLLELHVGMPAYPVYFSLSRGDARKFLEGGIKALDDAEMKP